MEIRWSPEAADDFEGAVRRILEDNPSNAERVAQIIYDRVAALPTFPNRGRAGRVEGTRELVIVPLPFIAVYRIKGETVEIVRVIHGAQEWPPKVQASPEE
jgi:toxin ParE1/3/4